MISVSQETIRPDDLLRDISADLALSPESAVSVSDAAIAIRYHGARYLPVVEDGCLVGIVAIQEQRGQARGDCDLEPDTHVRDRTARMGEAARSSSMENR